MAQPDSAADLIQSGHWKRARSIVEARLKEAPRDASAHFYLSQIRNAFGDRSTPLPLAEQAVALEAHVARYHRQVAEVLGVMAQHANAIQQLLLAYRFKREIDAALALDARDVQALRDLMEFYLLAPGVAGGDRHKARATGERISSIDAAEGYLAQARLATFENRAADTEAALKKAVEAQPPSYRARIALAEFCAAPERSNLLTAESAAKDAVRLDPGRAEAYAILAAIYAGQSRWSELDPILEDAAREVPDDLVAYYRAAERLIAARKDLPRAERYLRLYLAQEPEGNEPTLVGARQQLNRIAQQRHGVQTLPATGEGMLK